MTAKEKLKLNSPESAMNILEKDWLEALKKAKPDPVVGILHADLGGRENWRNHVASIPDKVGCHFHEKGDEIYEVVSGSATLYWGKVQRREDGSYQVIEEKPVDLRTGDSFVVPEGYAHQLKSTGQTPLVITFACPDSHLDDDQDRTMLPALAPF